MYLPLYKSLKLKESQLKPVIAPLVGFSGQLVMALGKINLLVVAEKVTQNMEFIVVDTPSQYNVISGRNWLHAIKGFPSTYHQKVRFLTPFGIKDIRGDKAMARKCIANAINGHPMKPNRVEEARQPIKDMGLQ